MSIVTVLELFICVTFCYIHIAQSSFNCPDHYEKFEDRCLKFHRDTKTWEEAKQACQKDDANLVTIEGTWIRDKLLERIAPNDRWDYYWVGAKEHHGVWKWEYNGQNIDANIWMPLEPNNWYGEEECMHFYSDLNNRLIGYRGLNDGCCGDHHPYICEQRKRDGSWTSWTNWSRCSATCGIGYKHQKRYCTNPTPRVGGSECNDLTSKKSKEETITITCKDRECPIDGQWDSWSPWSQCTKSCESGVKMRSRTCSKPKPQYGGKGCPNENSKETLACNTQNCPSCQIFNGTGSYKTTPKDVLNENETAEYICFPGYEKVKGDFKRTCQPNSTLTGGELECKASSFCNSSHVVLPKDGGYKACTGGNLDKICYMHCTDGKKYMGGSPVLECNGKTGWGWKVRPTGKTDYALIEGGDCAVPNSEVGLTTFLTNAGLQTNSSKSLEDLEKEIKDRMRNELINRNICTSPCEIKDIEIEKAAYRRAVSQQKLFKMKITLFAAPPKGSITNDQTARIELSKLMKLLSVSATSLKQAILSQTVLLQVDGVPVKLKGNNIQISQPSLACPDGSIRKGFHCYTCPEGTYHAVNDDKCAPCPIGQYQDIRGQPSCELCPKGTTTDILGASEASRCKDIGCPPGFTDTGKKCYLIPHMMMNHSNGILFCHGAHKDSHLVDIKDKTSYKILTNMIRPKGKYWLGLNDKANEGTFLHSDGTNMGQYSEWDSHNSLPTSNDHTKNCVVMDGAVSFHWKVVNCGERHIVICEFEKV